MRNRYLYLLRKSEAKYMANTESRSIKVGVDVRNSWALNIKKSEQINKTDLDCKNLSS